MKRTILIIEDNEQNLYMMRFMLEKHGFKVLVAADGKLGIEMAARQRPDCILLDIQLPMMDGYDVARTLRQNADLRDTPIIVVTSYAMAGDREKAISAGATDYIEKPIDPETFIDQIGSHLPNLA